MLMIGLLAIALLKQLEGFEANVYRNGGGRETIGYGHLVRAGEGWSGGITEAEGEQLLYRDLSKAEQAVNQLVKAPLNQNQFDAIVIWTYNLGPTNLKSSTLLKRLNSGHFEDVPNQLARWVWVTHKDTGKKEKLNGLVKRRNAEIKLWNSPVSA